MGVVLWSSVNDEKAVFWCEDHGDLAYFSEKTANDAQKVTFQTGDMVQFDITVELKTRHAYNACIIEQKVCKGLDEDLRKKVDQDVSAKVDMPTSGKVIPLHVPAQATRLPRKISSG